MIAFTKKIFAVGFILLSRYANGQSLNYSTANAHSHNDYLSARPFYLAYQNGFGSIEADVFPVNGILYVAHTKEEIQLKNTLNDLYITPLLHQIDSSRIRKLNLLVDIKENYKESLALLIKELEPLKKYLSTTEKENYITIIVSGDRPAPSAYKDYSSFIFFDDDFNSFHSLVERKRTALVSLPFNRISGWKGEGVIERKDRKKLQHVIDSAHSLGKPIRFWAAPDTKRSWKLQLKFHSDFIGTDKIDALADFLKERRRPKSN